MDFKLLLLLFLTIGGALTFPENGAPRLKRELKYADDTESFQGRDAQVENSEQSDVIRQIFLHLSKSRMKSVVEKLSSFTSRHSRSFSGDSEAEGWLRRRIDEILSEYDGSSTTRRVGDWSIDGKYNQENIIAQIQGEDDQVIILGAHYDSISGFAASPFDQQDRAPGADDNGTGVAVLLEVLQLIAKFGIRFLHTVEFHFYTGKETGLEGSQDVVTKYKEEKARVKGMLNLENLGYHSGEEKAIGYVENVVWDGKMVRMSELENFVKTLAATYLDPEFKMKEVDCSKTDRCLGDFFSWHLAGFPAAFVTEYEFNPNIHSEKDTTETLDFDQVNEFAKLAIAFVIEKGELYEIPEIPDPNATTEPSLAVKPEVALITGLGLSFIGIRLLY